MDLKALVFQVRVWRKRKKETLWTWGCFG